MWNNSCPVRFLFLEKRKIIDLAKPKSVASPFCFVSLFVLFLFFCWQLLICENTLIQVVKLKKKRKEKTFERKKFLSSLRV